MNGRMGTKNKDRRLRTNLKASRTDALFVWRAKENDCSEVQDNIFVQNICFCGAELIDARSSDFQLTIRR